MLLKLRAHNRKKEFCKRSKFKKEIGLYGLCAFSPSLPFSKVRVKQEIMTIPENCLRKTRTQVSN